MKEVAEHDIGIGGPSLARYAFQAGLVDEVHLFVNPVVVGGGKPGLPHGVQVDLELVGERCFGNRVVHMHHRVRREREAHG
jgi:dihydrofolate reductase